MTVWILVGKTENNSSLLDLLVFAKLSFQSLSHPLQALINSMLEQRCSGCRTQPPPQALPEPLHVSSLDGTRRPDISHRILLVNNLVW